MIPDLMAYLAELAAMANNCGNAEESRIAHDAVKADPIAWEAQELIGFQDCGENISLELRNCCKCGSTLAKKVSVRSSTDTGAQQIPHTV